MRKLLQEHLDNRSPGQCDDPPVQGADGIVRSRVRLQQRQLETVFGTVSVERAGYGQHGVKSLHPLDAELNLPDERYSLEMRRRVAEEAAKSSFDETLDSIGKNTAPYPQAPARRVGHASGGGLRRLLPDAPGASRQGSRRRLGIGHQRRWQGCDDANPGPAGADPQSRRSTCAQNGHASVQGGKEKCQAHGHRGGCLYDCTVCANTRGTDWRQQFPRRGPPRPRAEQKRVWASLEKEPEQVIDEALAEARHRDPEYEKTWVALVDGNKSQIRILKRLAKKNSLDLTIIVDLIHVIEYLWDAARVFHPDSGPELESWVRHRLLEIFGERQA